MKKVFQLAVFALGVALLIPAAHAQKTKFTATLSGTNEVPAVETSAHGRATFRLSRSGKSILYTVTVAGVENPTMAHIHMGAADANGPIVVWLYPTKAHPLKSGKVTGLLGRGVITESNLVGPLKGKTLADLLQEMRTGNTYVNVHSKANPGGELRGKIE
ncbi:MAG TPA: CHRD domain-containing protein [Patescibacteria group bacterium]|nr:CHRD domain-containing protein [Patescibacteria group bacterium]